MELKNIVNKASFSLKIIMFLIIIITIFTRGIVIASTVFLVTILYLYCLATLKEKKNIFSWQLNFLLTLVFLMNILGFTFLFKYFWWWDDIMHFVTPIVTGIVSFYLFFVVKLFGKIQVTEKIAAYIIFSSTISFCAIWEIYEFFVDQLFAIGMQDSLKDTMLDLLLGFLGTSILVIIMYIFKKEDLKKFLT